MRQRGVTAADGGPVGDHKSERQMGSTRLARLSRVHSGDCVSRSFSAKGRAAAQELPLENKFPRLAVLVCMGLFQF